MKKLLTLILLLTTTLFGASFDCTKAKTNVEKMICADEELSALDENLSKAFKEALTNTEDKEKLKKEQFAWMKERDKCQDKSCIKNIYNIKIQILIENLHDTNATTYLLLADRYAKEYNKTNMIEKLIGADHYYKLYVANSISEHVQYDSWKGQVHFDNNKNSVEKRASEFIEKNAKVLKNLTFPAETLIDSGKEECSYILSNAHKLIYLKPIFDLASNNPKETDETPFSQNKKQCPNLFPIGGGSSEKEKRDYERIYFVDINKDGTKEVIIQVNRYSFTSSASIKTIFDFYIADWNSCKKIPIVSRYYGDIGLNLEGFAQIDGDTYYYEKEFSDNDKNLTVPSKIVKITDVKYPIGYIEKTHQLSKNGEWCKFTNLENKFQSCLGYEFSYKQDSESKDYIHACTKLYEKLLKDKR